MRVSHRSDYGRRRREDYPPIEEQLDALWKALFKLQISGVDIGADATDMLAQVQAVKARYPKRIRQTL